MEIVEWENGDSQWTVVIKKFPISRIQHRVSSIEYQVSRIPYPASRIPYHLLLGNLRLEKILFKKLASSELPCYFYGLFTGNYPNEP